MATITNIGVFPTTIEVRENILKELAPGESVDILDKYIQCSHIQNGIENGWIKITSNLGSVRASYDSSGTFSAITNPEGVPLKIPKLVSNLDGSIQSIVGIDGSNTGAVLYSPVSNVGTRAWALGGAVAGAFNQLSTAGQILAVGDEITFAASAELETLEYDAIRIIFASAASTSTMISKATLSSCTDLSTSAAQVNDNGFKSGAAIPALFNGSPNCALPTGTPTLPSLLVTDWTSVSSQGRTDGGVMSAVSARMCMLANANGSAGLPAATPLTYWGRSGSDWTTEKGKFYTTYTNLKGDFTSAVLSNPNTSAVGNTPIFGFQYRTPRGVATIIFPGDSIIAASTLTSRKSRGYPVDSCQRVSTPTKPIEFVVAGFSGQAMSTWRAFLEAPYAGPTGGVTGISPGATNLEVLSPTHIMIPSWSVNDAATSTIVDAQIYAMRREATRLIMFSKSKNVIPVISNGVPRCTNLATGTPFYGPTDSTKRIAYNATALTWGLAGTNFGSVVASSYNPGSFKTIVGGDSVDLCETTGVHPNDAGDKLLALEMSKFISKLAGWYFRY